MRTSLTPPPSITARACAMNLVFYVGVLGGLALFLPDFRSPFWVNLLCLWAICGAIPFHNLRDLWTIQRTGKPVALTFLQSERRTNAGLRWAAVSYSVCAVVLILRDLLGGYMTLYEKGTVPDARMITLVVALYLLSLLLHSLIPLILWNMVAASNRYLASAHRWASGSLRVEAETQKVGQSK